MKRILVADDEAVILLQLEDVLTSMGFEVVATASSAEEALALARETRPQAVLLDVVMPGPMDGIEACAVIQGELGIPVVLLSAYSNQKHMRRVGTVAPAGYVVKPFQPDQVAATLNLAISMGAPAPAEESLREVCDTENNTYELLSTVLEEAELGVAVCDDTGSILYVNQRLSETLPEDAPAPEKIDDLPGVGRLQQLGVMHSPDPVRLGTRSGSPVLAGLRLVDMGAKGSLAIYNDVSSRYRAEAALAEHERVLDAKTRITDAFLSIVDANIYSRVATILTDCFDCEHAYFAYLDHDGNLVVPSFTGPIWDQCSMQDKQFIFPPETWGGLWGQSLTSHETVIRNSDLALPEGHLKLKNAMATPIVHHHKVIGQFLLADRPEGFTELEKSSLEAVASYCAPVLAARMERESMEKERMESARQLMNSEERYRTIVETSLEGIWTLSEDGYTTYANANIAGMFGTTPKSIQGTHYFDYVPPESIPEAEKRLAKCRDGFSSQFDFRFRHAGGANVWAIVSMSPIMDDGGTFRGTLIMTSDITFRKFAETSLQESEERFRQLVENLDEVFWVREFESGLGLYVSPNFETVWGLSAAKFTKENFFFLDAVHPQDKPRVVQAKDTFQQTSEPYSIEFRILLPNGSTRWLRLSASAIFDDAGTPYRAVGVSQDITARKHTMAERDRLALAIDQLEEIVLITDTWGRIQYVNQAYERVSGRPRDTLLGQSIGVLESKQSTPDYLLDLNRALNGHETWYGHYVYDRDDGHRREVKATIAPIRDETGRVAHYVSVQRDVTEELHMENQLNQARKMEALGTLAGGIAHDFNNILMAIMGFTELALRQAGDGSPQGRHLNRVLQAGERARNLVRQILAFSRRGEIERAPLELPPLVKETIALLRATLPANVAIKRDISPDTGTVLADPGQIHQVVMNLCTNAAQALEAMGGTITVGLRNVEPPPLDNAGTSASGHPLAELVVKDDGPGIPEDIIDRVFDPFFTTKSPGSGTGMGLSVVHGTVTALGGSITVANQPGGGAKFTVLLPTIEGESSMEHALPDAVHHGQGEHILFVDDEPDILTLAQAHLESYGFTLDTVSTPQEALSILKEGRTHYDILITDQTMPGSTGLELARSARALRPNMPIILCTGFSRQIRPETLIAHGVDRLVMKPFNFEKLTTTITSLLIRSRQPKQ